MSFSSSSVSSFLGEVAHATSNTYKTVVDTFTGGETNELPGREVRLPPALERNWGILSKDDQAIARKVLRLDQQHLFENWDEPGVNDADKRAFLDEIRSLNAGIDGGLGGYIERARALLKDSQMKVNPFPNCTPTVPEGKELVPFTETYREFEQVGINYLGKCGFVLVAGGLGERLGYRGIKVELPVQTITYETYLGHYCTQILAIQQRCGAGRKIPLAIMVSNDTSAGTRDLLERENYFGLDRSQVTFLVQGVVPALLDNDARIATTSTYKINAKPHGHGDVHELMRSTGTAEKWLGDGVEYVVFFQDTNGLAFITLPAVLGVSVSLQLEVNTLAVPRYAKQAAGAITKLVYADGRSITVNVEYNQLDPLLKATGHPDGDVNDPRTGLSPFPGNTNQLIFALPPYVNTLRNPKNRIHSFVNPKYKDESRKEFKKPARLECMMQDYPKLLPKEAKVGYTMAPAWLCYSPCKNNAADGAASFAAGIPASCPYTAESDQYAVYWKLLKLMGVEGEEAPVQRILGVEGVPSPRLVIHPSCAIFPHELAERFPHPKQVWISAHSTLVLKGDVVVDRLRLNGSLLVESKQGKVRVRLPPGREIANAGHVLHVLEGEEMNKASEMLRMRGYCLKEEAMTRCEVTDDSDQQQVYNGLGLITLAESDAQEREIEQQCKESRDAENVSKNDVCFAWLWNRTCNIA